jgi:hypothetical protein
VRVVEHDQILGFSDGVICVRIKDQAPELGERFLIHKEYSSSGIAKVTGIDKIHVTKRQAKIIISRETYWMVDMEASLEDPCDVEHLERIST